MWACVEARFSAQVRSLGGWFAAAAAVMAAIFLISLLVGAGWALWPAIVVALGVFFIIFFGFLITVLLNAIVACSRR